VGNVLRLSHPSRSPFLSLLDFRRSLHYPRAFPLCLDPTTQRVILLGRNSARTSHWKLLVTLHSRTLIRSRSIHKLYSNQLVRNRNHRQTFLTRSRITKESFVVVFSLSLSLSLSLTELIFSVGISWFLDSLYHQSLVHYPSTEVHILNQRITKLESDLLQVPPSSLYPSHNLPPTDPFPVLSCFLALSSIRYQIRYQSFKRRGRCPSIPTIKTIQTFLKTRRILSFND